MFENFCSDIIQTMKCFALESFNLSCQVEHTKINSRLNFNPGLALNAFWTTRPRGLFLKTLIDTCLLVLFQKQFWRILGPTTFYPRQLVKLQSAIF